MHELTGDFMVVDSASDLYPTGNGGSSATAGNSIFATKRKGVLLSVIVSVLDTATRTITIEDHDGNAVVTMDTGLSNPGVATFAPSHFPMGPAGIQFNNGLRANIAGVAEAIIVYQAGKDL